VSTISIVIPAFGNQHALDLSLATLHPQTRWMRKIAPYERWECIVVDDGSDPPLKVPDWCMAARIPRDPIHRGSSAAKNYGASLATGQYLAFCDSDILHLPDALESLLATIHQWEADGQPDVLLNTMRVSLPDGYKDKYIRDVEKLLTKCRSANLLNDEAIETSALCYEQNESLIRRSYFFQLGGYDAASFPSWGMNNQDLDLRVAMSGGRISSAIPRASTGQRLHCFHIFHENHISKQKATEEFVAKWGVEWSDRLYQQTYAMVQQGGMPRIREAMCQSN
jgi:glycosyltransferase involved in cell wall biosynthesis